MQTDRDWRTGCYNTDCPGFVPFKDSYTGIPKPGMVVEALSSYNQTDSSMILQIVKVACLRCRSSISHSITIIPA